MRTFKDLPAPLLAQGMESSWLIDIRYNNAHERAVRVSPLKSAAGTSHACIELAAKGARSLRFGTAPVLYQDFTMTMRVPAVVLPLWNVKSIQRRTMS